MIEIPPWQCYVDDVIAGRIDVCQWVRLACERHNRDLARDDVYLDEAAAWRPIRFLSMLKHYEGEFLGRPFELEPWQAWIVASMYGWRWRSSGLRKYKRALLKVPRKNGKTILGAGLALYATYADNEAAAQVYTGATKEDQAKLSWIQAEAMIQGSADPGFIGSFKITQKPPIIKHPASRSFFRPLSREAKSYDGLNTHFALFDELHAWTESTQKLLDVIASSMAARRQPMICMITTGGDILEGPLQRQEDAIKSILLETIPGDSFFGAVYTLDDDDIYTEDPDTGDKVKDLTRLEDPKLWAKANPNLGVSINLEGVQEEYNTALETKSFGEMLMKRFNININSQSAWIDIDEWDKCYEEIDTEILLGKKCFGGLDLAQVRDHSALALLFPPQEGIEKWTVLMSYWCPLDNIPHRTRIDGVPYQSWLDDGHIIGTPGRVTDYRYINNEIVRLSGIYDIHSIGFDRTFSGALVQDLLDEAIDMVQFGQGFVSMNSPCCELQRQVIGAEINHLNHPILRWNAANAITSRDPAGNIKIDKRNAEKMRVDGLVALAQALGLATVEADKGVGLERW